MVKRRLATYSNGASYGWLVGGSRRLAELIEQRSLTPDGWILAVQTTKIGLKNLFNPIFYDQLGPNILI